MKTFLKQSARTSSKPDPYVVVTVGNRSQQTSARMRTCDPTWEHAMTFLVCNPDADDVYLKVRQSSPIMPYFCRIRLIHL